MKIMNAIAFIKIPRFLRLSLLLWLLPGLSVAAASAVLHWPTRPVTIVVPYPPGGTSDTVARIIAHKLQLRFGQAFLVDNRAGASGNIGAKMVAKSAPDGYTLLVGGPNNFASNQFLFKNLGYDIEKDLTGIVVLERHPVVLVAPKGRAVKNVVTLIAASQAKPKTFNCAHPGVATLPHLVLELLKKESGADLQAIPYKGSSALLPDLLGGRLECVVDGLTAHVDNLKQGAYQALAVSTPERWHLMPDIPTFTELGYPQIQATVWFALAAPTGTPMALLSDIAAAVNSVLQEPDTATRFAAFGASVGGGSVAETNAFFKDESRKWQSVITHAKLVSE